MKSKLPDHMMKGSCDLMEGSFSLYITTLPGLMAICIGIVVVEINFFYLPRDLTWPRVQRVVWLNGLNFLIISHHFAKFSGHRLCGSCDTAAKIFNFTLQDYGIKWSGDFMVENSLLYIPTLPKLTAINNVLMTI